MNIKNPETLCKALEAQTKYELSAFEITLLGVVRYKLRTRQGLTPRQESLLRITYDKATLKVALR